MVRGDQDVEDGVTEDLWNDFEDLLEPVESDKSPFEYIGKDLMKECKMDPEMMADF